MIGSNTSIVIPHYGSAEMLQQCVESLMPSLSGAEVIIIDNSGALEPVEGCSVITNAVNVGFARACNQGARLAARENIIFLNNDTKVSEDWLRLLVEAAKEPDVGIVGCELRYPDGSLQHAGTEIVRDSNGMLRGFNLTEERPSGEVVAVTAASMLVKRQAFEAVGGFDELYWNSHEDVDLCLAVRGAGYRIYYESKAVVEHRESASGEQRFVGIDDARRRFHAKWSGKIVATRQLGPDDVHQRTIVDRARRLARASLKRIAPRR